MAIYTLNFDGGTEGASVSAAALGITSMEGPTPFPTWSSAAAVRGARGLRTSAAAQMSALRQEFAATDAVAIRSYFRVPARTPSSETILIRVGAGSAAAAMVTMNNWESGKLDLRDVGTTRRHRTEVGVPVETAFCLDLYVKAGTTTTNGVYHFDLYADGNATPIATYRASDANLGIGSTLTRVSWGKYSAEDALAYDIDETIIHTGIHATGLIGPYRVPLATPNPTVTARVKPSAPGGSNGTTTLSWPAVTDASHYEVSMVNGTIATPAEFAAASPTVLGSPTGTTFTATGLSAGTRTFGVRAMPEA